jgi:hypothetical protein
MDKDTAVSLNLDMLGCEDTADGLSVIVGDLQSYCYAAAFLSGAWADPKGQPLTLNKGTLNAKLMPIVGSLALAGVHAEVDGKVFTAALAESLIAILDCAKALDLPLGDVVAEKLRYNHEQANKKLGASHD